MPDLGKRISFSELLEAYQRIEVPQIQRDYAQGRDTAKDIRDEFLDALHGALQRTRDDETLPLNLDFVYGCIEEKDGKFFLPLDGQQRLTTLFLLHWYLAWRDEQLPGFRELSLDGRHSRFSYTVRPSSTEFFDELAQYVPDDSPDGVSNVRTLIENQPWFYLHWRLDPTIQSALTMLDAIHGQFSKSSGMYSRLLDKERPAITFQLLPLEHFGLSDDLYIKMNARGKPLTPFETFKARFEEHLKQLDPTKCRDIGGTPVPVHDYFSRRMDTWWTDFFWSHRTLTSDVIDDAAMNLFWIVAWVSVDPDNRGTADSSMARYRQGVGGYSEFRELGLLTKAFTDNLISLLEAWSSGGRQLHQQLPDTQYFDETAFFTKASTLPTSLQYGDLVLFAAFISYLSVNESTVIATEFQEWMRVAFNLIQNSDIERPDDFERSLGGLRKLLPYSRSILPHLAKMENVPLGFSREQLQEESLKARLMLAHRDWVDRIHVAETHGYFRGQIGFLLDFSGASALADERPVQDWLPTDHTLLQGRFDEYLAKAERTFNERGLAELPGELHQWKRSLLVMGNYLMPIGLNYSFVTDPPSSPDSWKRFLRGGTSASGREHLKTLWDRLDISAEIGPQLAALRVTPGLEPWSAAIVAHPEVIEYCLQRKIRWETGAKEIYLLRQKQMNGAHAELFTYVLHLELDTESMRKQLDPLHLEPYQFVNMTDTEPHFALTMGDATFCVMSTNDQFRIEVARSGLAATPVTEKLLADDLGFIQGDALLTHYVSRVEAHYFLFNLASKLAKVKST